MLLLYTVLPPDAPASPIPGASGRRGSAWGRLLLASAWSRFAGGKMPRPGVLPGGKPWFPQAPQIHFSLSHTAGLVLCALGEIPVGADAERPRQLRPGTAEKLMTPREAADFDFFQLWTLRESYFKLTGRGGPRGPRFCRTAEGIRCEDGDVYFSLYEIAGCPAAVCARRSPALTPEAVPLSELLDAAPPLYTDEGAGIQ